MKLDRLRITGVTCALLALHGCKVLFVPSFFVVLQRWQERRGAHGAATVSQEFSPGT